MKAISLGAMLLPPEAMAILLILAGLLLVLGMRRIAGILALLAIVGAMMPALAPILDAALEELPVWVSLLLLAGFVVFVLQALGLSKFAREALAHATGILLADLIRLVFSLPFRAVAFLFRVLTGRGR